MSKQNDFMCIGEVYGKMLNGVRHKLVAEGKTGPPKAKQAPKVKEGEIGDVSLEDGGPAEKGGFTKKVIDKKVLTKKQKKDNLYNINRLSDCDCDEDEEEMSKETKKIVREGINTFMRKKSYFDRLVESAMNPNGAPSPMGGGGMGNDTGLGAGDEGDDLDALGIEGEDDDMGMEGEGEDVTFTLDRETAQKLIDVLQGALGEGEDLGDLDAEGEDDFGGEDEFGDDNTEDEENFWDEDEEELGTPVSSPKELNMGKNNKVGNLKAQSGGASSAYTNKVGNDGDHGHSISSGKQPNMGKSNKVGSLKTGKSMFEQ